MNYPTEPKTLALYLTEAEAKALFSRLRKPNNVDEWVRPLVAIRNKLAVLLEKPQ